jgi:hypothetical protein
MLTVIYVYEPATLTIQTRDPRDEHAILRRYDQKGPPSDLHALRQAGPLKLEPGVYAILSRKGLSIDWSGARVETATLSKDDWPDPPGLATGASQEQIKTFFASVAEKGGEVP